MSNRNETWIDFTITLLRRITYLRLALLVAVPAGFVIGLLFGSLR